MPTAQTKYVLIIPDGAPDLHRVKGRTPLAEAALPYWDWLTANGLCGLMQTLYVDLPRGSIVAQLGMLGWDPRRCSGHGRAAWELLAVSDVHLGPDDLVFRANLVQMDGRRLVSYNAQFIHSQQAVHLVDRINAVVGPDFPGIELYHNSDFRNSLVIRDAHAAPSSMQCPEPHDHQGSKFDIARLISGSDAEGQAVAARVNRYLLRVAELLHGGVANMLFPWSASRPLTLPSFYDNTGFEGRAAIIGCVDFLQGIAKAGGLVFVKMGNGRPDTDYAAKGRKVLELLADGYSFVVCHINAPDEAAHMRDRRAKIHCLEAIDAHVLRPVVEYFAANCDELGGVMVAPDHYTNLLLGATRAEAHSVHPVPFVLWNGQAKDAVTRFDEDAVRAGLYGATPVSHLHLLQLLGVKPAADAASPCYQPRATTRRTAAAASSISSAPMP